MVSTAPALALSKTAGKMPAPSPRVSLILSTWVSYITEIRLKSADFGFETRRSCVPPIQEGVSEVGDQGCLIGSGGWQNLHQESHRSLRDLSDFGREGLY